MPAVAQPPAYFLLGNAPDFMRGKMAWEVCSHYAQKYGPVCEVRLPGVKALALNHPAVIEAVLDTKWEKFYKDAPCAALAPVITPKSLFVTNPPAWQAARRTNPLSEIDMSQWLDDVQPSMVEFLRAQLSRWSSTSQITSIDLYQSMMRLAFDTFATAFWGVTFGDDVFQWFLTLADTGDRRMKLPVLPTPPLDPIFYWRRRKWYDFFETLVAARRSQPKGQDLLSRMLESGVTMDDETLAEALATNFFGGVFSASSTINTTLYLLSRDDNSLRDVQEAVRQHGSVKDPGNSIDNCTTLDYTLREAMRYYPAVPLYFRSVGPEPVRVAGYTLEPKTLLFISNWFLHKHSDHWDEPELFRPQRWADGVAEQNPFGSDYFFPFGRGPRACIGMPFALRFMKLALAVILQTTDLRMVPSQSYKQSFYFGVMMPKGLRARFHKVD